MAFAINQFPSEILFYIFSHLPSLSIPKIERVCRRWKAVCAEREIQTIKESILLQRPVLIKKIPEPFLSRCIATAHNIKLNNFLRQGMVKTDFPNLIADPEKLLYIFAKNNHLHVMASHSYCSNRNVQQRSIIAIQIDQSLVTFYLERFTWESWYQTCPLTRKLDSRINELSEGPRSQSEPLKLLFQEHAELAPPELHAFQKKEREVWLAEHKAKEAARKTAPPALPPDPSTISLMCHIKKIGECESLKDRLKRLFPQYIITDQTIRALQGDFHSLHLLELGDHFFLIKKVHDKIIDILIPFDQGNGLKSYVFYGEPTDYNRHLQAIHVGRFRIEAHKNQNGVRIDSYPLY